MPRRLEPDVLPRVAFGLAHALAFGAALWLLAGGDAVVGPRLGLTLEPGDGPRRALLAGCGAVLLLRLRLTTGPFLWRPFGWWAALRLTGLAAAFQLGFAWAGAPATAPLGGWIDRAGLLLFLGGSALSTGSELIRSRRLAATQRRSALCTDGPFAVVRHPGLLGDLCWGLGWALLTRNLAALALPLAVAAWQGRRSAVEIERELEAQEGPLFRAWASKTSRLIPFVY